MYSTDVGSHLEVLVFFEDGPEPFGLVGLGLVVVMVVTIGTLGDGRRRYDEAEKKLQITWLLSLSAVMPE
jgi:hypothetical protein